MSGPNRNGGFQVGKALSMEKEDGFFLILDRTGTLCSTVVVTYILEVPS